MSEEEEKKKSKFVTLGDMRPYFLVMRRLILASSFMISRARFSFQ
jgi:hypothetical protein